MRLLAKSVLPFLLCLLVLLAGCGLLSEPAPKPESGPTGKPVESQPNPPFWAERFFSAPAALYDLEAAAGVVFEGINKENWEQAQAGCAKLQTLWQQTKAATGDKKGIKTGDEAIEKLMAAVNTQQTTESYENLIAFMSSASDVGKSYKLSPVADMIAVSNGMRNVSFFAEGRDWKKAAAKVKELQGIWEQVKPGMEQIGILGEITKTHAAVKQMKDAVNAENSGAFQEQQAKMNESMGRIREFFRGK